MVLADTLSRLPNPEKNAEIELDLRVDGIDLVIDDPECKTIALINFPPHKRQLLRDETTRSSTELATKHCSRRMARHHQGIAYRHSSVLVVPRRTSDGIRRAVQRAPNTDTTIDAEGNSATTPPGTPRGREDS